MSPQTPGCSPRAAVRCYPLLPGPQKADAGCPQHAVSHPLSQPRPGPVPARPPRPCARGRAPGRGVCAQRPRRCRAGVTQPRLYNAGPAPSPAPLRRTAPAGSAGAAAPHHAEPARSPAGAAAAAGAAGAAGAAAGRGTRSRHHRGLRTRPAVRRRDVLRRQPLDPQPEDVHPHGKPGRRVPPLESQSALLGAADAPQLPVPAGPGLPPDCSQQVQVFTRLQERRRLLLAGTLSALERAARRFRSLVVVTE